MVCECYWQIYADVGKILIQSSTFKKGHKLCLFESSWNSGVLLSPRKGHLKFAKFKTLHVINPIRGYLG